MDLRFNYLKDFLTVLILLIFIPQVSGQQQKKAPKTYIIEISKMKFIPSDLVVEKESKVVWVNKDFYPHDVTDEVKKVWSSKPLNQSQSWSKIVTKNENYFCNLHKMMKGRITVK